MLNSDIFNNGALMYVLTFDQKMTLSQQVGSKKIISLLQSLFGKNVRNIKFACTG